VHRREDVHFDHQPRSTFREVIEWAQKRHRGVVHQDVWRTDFFDQLSEQSFAVFGFDRSAWMASAEPPAAMISLTVCCNDPWYFGSGSMVRAGEPDVAPSRASHCAIAFPVRGWRRSLERPCRHTLPPQPDHFLERKSLLFYRECCSARRFASIGTDDRLPSRRVANLCSALGGSDAITGKPTCELLGKLDSSAKYLLT